MKFGLKMCHVDRENRKWETIEGIERPNGEKIKILGEKDN